jgi:hypothetical protein
LVFLNVEIPPLPNTRVLASLLKLSSAKANTIMIDSRGSVEVAEHGFLAATQELNGALKAETGFQLAHLNFLLLGFFP